MPARCRAALPARSWFQRSRDRLLAWPLFHRALLAFFVLEAVSGLLGMLLVGAAAVAVPRVFEAALAEGAGLEPGWLPLGSLAASAAQVALVLAGAIRLSRSRPAALRWFKRSLLVSILLSQVFVFWQDQFAGLVGFAVDSSCSRA